jgi:hypothetical protein
MSKFNFHRSFIYIYSSLYILSGLIIWTIILTDIALSYNSNKSRSNSFDEPFTEINDLPAPLNNKILILISALAFASLMTVYGLLGVKAILTNSVKSLLLIKRIALLNALAWYMFLHAFAWCLWQVLLEYDYVGCVITVLVIGVLTKLVFDAVNYVVGEIEATRAFQAQANLSQI